MSALAPSGPPAPAPDRVLVLMLLPASRGKVHAHAAYKRDAEGSRAVRKSLFLSFRVMALAFPRLVPMEVFASVAWSRVKLIKLVC